MDSIFKAADGLDPVAVYAAVVATFVFVWDIIKWRRQGPKLKLRTMVPAVLVKRGTRKGVSDAMLATVTVVNIGDAPTTVTGLHLTYWPSWWKRLLRYGAEHMIVPDPIVSGTAYGVPHELARGQEWMGAMNYDDEIKKMAEEGFLYFDVYHSMDTKPVRIRVKESNRKRADDARADKRERDDAVL